MVDVKVIRGADLYEESGATRNKEKRQAFAATKCLASHP